MCSKFLNLCDLISRALAFVYMCASSQRRSKVYSVITFCVYPFISL